VFFLRELESDIFKLHDLWIREVGTKLDTGGNEGRFWSAKNLLTHLRREPLRQRSMSSRQKKNFSALGVVNL
jgi:hypothetical protein